MSPVTEGTMRHAASGMHPPMIMMQVCWSMPNRLETTDRLSVTVLPETTSILRLSSESHQDQGARLAWFKVLR